VRRCGGGRTSKIGLRWLGRCRDEVDRVRPRPRAGRLVGRPAKGAAPLSVAGSVCLPMRSGSSWLGPQPHQQSVGRRLRLGGSRLCGCDGGPAAHPAVRSNALRDLAVRRRARRAMDPADGVGAESVDAQAFPSDRFSGTQDRIGFPRLSSQSRTAWSGQTARSAARADDNRDPPCPHLPFVVRLGRRWPPNDTSTAVGVEANMLNVEDRPARRGSVRWRPAATPRDRACRPDPAGSGTAIRISVTNGLGGRPSGRVRRAARKIAVTAGSAAGEAKPLWRYLCAIAAARRLSAPALSVFAPWVKKASNGGGNRPPAGPGFARGTNPRMPSNPPRRAAVSRHWRFGCAALRPPPSDRRTSRQADPFPVDQTGSDRDRPHRRPAPCRSVAALSVVIAAAPLASMVAALGRRPRCHPWP